MKRSLSALIIAVALAGCGTSYEEMRAQDQIAYDAFDEVMSNGEIISSDPAAFGATKMVVKYKNQMYTCFMHSIGIDKSRCVKAK